MKIFKPASLGKGIQVLGSGTYLPSRVVTNADLAAMGAPLTPEEMVKLSGIETRHWVAEDEATSDLAVAAGKEALAAAGLDPDQVDRLILATVSPDYSSPSAACLAHRGL